MKLNILGTEYQFDETTQKEDSGLFDKEGHCDTFAKRIAVETDFAESHPDSIKDFDALKKQVKRHEIVHAYFAESGMKEYRENETLVDWLAWQFPKLLESFKEVDAL